MNIELVKRCYGNCRQGIQLYSIVILGTYPYLRHSYNHGSLMADGTYLGCPELPYLGLSYLLKETHQLWRREIPLKMGSRMRPLCQVGGPVTPGFCCLNCAVVTSYPNRGIRVIVFLRTSSSSIRPTSTLATRCISPKAQIFCAFHAAIFFHVRGCRSRESWPSIRTRRMNPFRVPRLYSLMRPANAPRTKVAKASR